MYIKNPRIWNRKAPTFQVEIDQNTKKWLIGA